MSNDFKEEPLEALDQSLNELRSIGRGFPVRESTLEQIFRRTRVARISPAFRARIHALLDDGSGADVHRALGAQLAGFRTHAGVRSADLARKLDVSLARLEGLEAGRAHPALFEPAFWRDFGIELGVPPRQLANFLAGTAQLISASITPIVDPAWAADVELPEDRAAAEAMLRERLAAICAELERG
jgi:helix-turn-helix protein